jgi:hypothetical protein
MAIKPQPFAFQTPGVTQGWGAQYNPASILSSFLYDIFNQILYTIYPTNVYDIWLTVPTSLAMQLTLAGKQYNSNPNFPNPDTIYLQQIFTPASGAGIEYGQCFIATDSGTQMATNSGLNLITDQNISVGILPPLGTAYYPRCILSERGAAMLTEAGSYLVV